MGTRSFSVDRLLGLMASQKVSRRELSRRVKPWDPDNARAALHKHLTGRHVPAPKTVQAYADALGVTPEALTDPDPLAERVDAVRSRHNERVA